MVHNIGNILLIVNRMDHCLDAFRFQIIKGQKTEWQQYHVLFCLSQFCHSLICGNRNDVNIMYHSVLPNFVILLIGNGFRVKKIPHTGDKESFTDADSRTDTIWERLHDLSLFYFVLFFREVTWFFRLDAIFFVILKIHKKLIDFHIMYY